MYYCDGLSSAYLLEAKQLPFKDFRKKYTVLPHNLIHEFSSSKAAIPSFENMMQLHLKSLSHIQAPCDMVFAASKLDEQLIEYSMTSDLKTLEITSIPIEYFLCFPHRNLQYFHDLHERKSSRALPVEVKMKYKNALEFYNKIEAKSVWLHEKMESASMTENSWEEILNDIEDDENMIANLEYLLGLYPTKKVIWNYYIKFLKEKQPQLLLNIYRRYCRLFHDDEEMKDEYEKEYTESMVDEVQDLTLYKKLGLALQEAINKHKKINDKIKKSKGKGKTGKRDPNSKKKTFAGPVINLKTAQKQDILPLPTLSYIFENANTTKISKLRFTCKCLYLFYPYPICREIIVSSNSKFNYDQHSVNLSSNIDDLKHLPSLCLIDRLMLIGENVPRSSQAQVYEASYYSSTPRNFTSLLIPMIRKCNLTQLHIPYQDLTMKEFEFLITGGTLKSLEMRGTNVFYLDGRKVPHVYIQIALKKNNCTLTYGRFW